MIDDVLAALPGLTAALLTDPGRWQFVGVVASADDAGLVRAALGPAFEVGTEPYAANLAVGGNQWIRSRTHWEVWVRATALTRQPYPTPPVERH